MLEMLTIRTAQLQVFEEAGFRRFAEELQPILEASTHPSLAVLKNSGIPGAAYETIGRARSYGLSGHQDVTSFFDLTAEYGLAFEDRPEHSWVRAQLTDPFVSDPSRRIALVLDEISRRGRIADHNRSLRDAFEERAKKPK
jgi:hypothetical protein